MLSLKRRLFSLLNLNKENFKKIVRFENVVKNIEERISISEDEFERGYSKLNLLCNSNVQVINNLLTKHCSIITEEGLSNVDSNRKYLKDNYNLNDYQLNFILKTVPALLYNNINILTEKIDYLINNYNFNKEDIEHVLKNYPNCLTFEYSQLNTNCATFYEYLVIPKEQYCDIIKKYPFFINYDNYILKDSIIKLSKINITLRTIQKIVTEYPIIFLYKTGGFVLTINYLKTHFLKKEDYDMFFNYIETNPKFIFQHINYDTKIKINYLRKDLLMDDESIRQLILYYPESFSKSVENWKLKIKYLKKRFKYDVKKELSFPEIIKYDYISFIRARGEVADLQKKTNSFKWEEVLYLSDEEFCKKVGVEIETLEAKKKEVSNNGDFLYEISKIKSVLWKNCGKDLRELLSKNIN